MAKAATNGHLNAVRWLHKYHTDGCTKVAMNLASLNGHLEIVQWLHANRKEGCTTDAMDWAAEKGHLAVVQWLHENRTEGCTTEAMDCAARQGHLDMVKWLHVHRTEGCSNRAMEDAAWEDHIEVARWLDENTIQRVARWGICEAAQRGGDLDGLLVIFERLYGIGVIMAIWERNEMRKCFTRVLDQLNQNGYVFSSASSTDATLCGLLRSLERYHNDGYLVCACAMLQLALKRGYFALVEAFFMQRSAADMAKYVESSVLHFEMVLARWLLEKEATLNIPTATTVARALKAWRLCAGPPKMIEWFWSVKDLMTIGERR